MRCWSAKHKLSILGLVECPPCIWIIRCRGGDYSTARTRTSPQSIPLHKRLFNETVVECTRCGYNALPKCPSFPIPLLRDDFTGAHCQVDQYSLPLEQWNVKSADLNEVLVRYGYFRYLAGKSTNVNRIALPGTARVCVMSFL